MTTASTARCLPRTLRARAIVAGAVGAAILVGSASAHAQGMRRRGMANGAEGASAFLLAERCALCHSLSPRATALRTATGADGSPHGLWSGSMMAQSFRDPYWRAQVAREVRARPEQAAGIQSLCLTCHAPMPHHDARLDGTVINDVPALARHAHARDGVSCTVCHQAQPDGLGTLDSFNGRLVIKPEKRIFGPYANPAPGPMRMHTGYTPTHGPHVQDSALCGSCHTLHTGVPGAASSERFPEQSPYLEWRNSADTDHDGATATSRSCQSCHMADLGSLRIARNPGGRDFNIAVRDHVRGHQIVGGNAFMLDLLAANALELGVTAPTESLARAAAAVRAQLYTGTATVEVRDIRREGAELAFDVVVTNLTGHKFPTGYPARRAWLQTYVQCGNERVFTSGEVNDRGMLGLAGAIAEPLERAHVDVVEHPEQVPVYELVPHDRGGRPTTLLTDMATRGKDNRLLPAGWSPDGPFAEDTAPVGVDGDVDFGPGRDVVHYRVPLPASDAPRARVTVWLRYQSVPPTWVDPMRHVRAAEITRFLRMYDEMEPAAEAVAVTVAMEE